MKCGTCDHTDGLIYTSYPPKIKCKISDKFHGLHDGCDISEMENKEEINDVEQKEAANVVIITTHARKRVKQRIGIPKKSVDRNAENAIRSGIHRTEVSGSLRRYLDKLYFKEKTADNIVIYCGHIYLFTGEKLITVFSVPDKYKSTVNRLIADR